MFLFFLEVVLLNCQLKYRVDYTLDDMLMYNDRALYTDVHSQDVS